VEPAEPAPAAAPTTVPTRSERSPRDMALSLVVLLVPIALLLGFYRVVLGGDDPITVDPRPAIEQAQAAKAFPVSAPNGLRDDWHVTNATFRRTADGATLRLGYVDPDGGPVQLVQSSVPLESLVKSELGDKVEGIGPVRAGTRTWQRYDARPGENALVLLEKGRTIIVVGATEPENLQELAAALP
jgi:hypothetical protein